MAGQAGGSDVPKPFNILPFHDMSADNQATIFPGVQAALKALQTSAKQVRQRPPPEMLQWTQEHDIMDWLGAFFGFQSDNIANQREHVVMLLANYQMRLPHPPRVADRLDGSVVQLLRKKLLKNYKKWCAFLHVKSSVLLIKDRRYINDRRELIYPCLYLLIWGEAGNLRFMPECLCFIFHNMAKELNLILDKSWEASLPMPFSCGTNNFLRKVVFPIYKAVKEEAEASKEGKAPHSAWRNYDDMNEYFWSKRCINQNLWPIKGTWNYLVTGEHQQKVGKTGFVEQRSFFHIYRSFDHLWIGLILMFQAMMILAFHGDGLPWDVLHDRDVQGLLLSIFITWSSLRLFQAVLDAGMQYSLISSETKLIGVRMLLKIVVASAWTSIFSVLLARVWKQRISDRGWSVEANMRLIQFLETATVFILPELLALLLFVLPWIRILLEKSEFRLIHALTWWFQTRLFVAQGLREGFTDNLQYTVFWLVILAAKFSFSYFLQVRPLVEPTRELLKLNVISFEWHEFFRNHNRFVVVVLWTPVVLIYFMDLQIWYAFFSSIVGAALGLRAHLGEIRNVEQLKLRFPFFASATAFNLMPENTLLYKEMLGHHRLIILFRNMVQRVKLRYGLGKGYKEFESDTLEARKFAFIWNKIVSYMREEDLVSNHEVELLEIPGLSWNVSVIQWPCVLLSNGVIVALGFTQKWNGYGSDKDLWAKICKNDYRRCAVLECYDSIKHLLNMILKEQSNERRMMQEQFKEIEAEIEENTFTKTYKVNEIVEVHARVSQLVNILLTRPGEGDMQTVVDALQNLHEVMTKDFRHVGWFQHRESLRRASLSLMDSRELLFVDKVELPNPTDEAFFRRLRRFSTILTAQKAMHDVPKNLNARRRIAFFSNSLFMNMPRAPPVEKMLAFSVLTPYYSEDVVYSKEQLRCPNEDGITILFYLQSIFPDEWQNFLERIKMQNNRHHEVVLWKDRGLARELRLWASYRGQTLARTVRGMMYYQHALQTLAFIDRASEYELREEPRIVRAPSRKHSSSGINIIHRFDKEAKERATTSMKFTYVVACQIYGTQKANKDSRAENILFLMKQYPAIRVAYVDEVEVIPENEDFGKGKDKETAKLYYSVLVKYDASLGKEVEVYRIQLPGPLKLGEGKPENQNHAIIFTRGDALQTIDMNQDNYFEEALKIRNLLQEFTKHYGLRRPQILGVREHVFTGSVSSLAWFMSAQETSFVTLGQRVLAKPLKVRMHYGHPDLFDRLWFLTRGGISKASRVINISEDIFAGFNCTLRGGTVTHHEYIQVGKGRDVGLNQIALFEAKVSSGNGEQMLSRDVYRLGHRLDFFRMLSFYHTTVGFYVNNMIIVLTVYAFLWGRVYLALSGLENLISRSLSSSALMASLNQQFLVQVGVFTALPMIVENSLEHGFSRAVWDFLTMQLEFCSVFFTFSLGTKGHYFGRTLLHGGAKYRATGRGFVVRHEKFAEIYRMYARSHFVKGVELVILLVVYESYGGIVTNPTVYIMLTFSSWFLAFSWIMGPFLFNPSGFDWLQTVYDFEDFQTWLWYEGGVLTKADQSWEVWWYEEQDHLRTTGFWGQILEVILSLRFFLIQYGLVYRLHIASNNKSIVVYLLSWIYIIISLSLCIVVKQAGERFAAKQHLYYRLVQSLVGLFVVLVVVILFEFTSLNVVDIFLSLLAFAPTGWGILSICLVLRPFLVNTRVWPIIVCVARLYELALGILVMVPVGILSWLPGFQAMQTRILFNQAFSQGLQISRILAGKKPNQGF